MGLNVKKVLAFAGGIAATVSTGGFSAPILIPQILSGVSDILPEGKTSEQVAAEAELDHWERIKIAQWVETYRRLMDRSVGNLAQVFQGFLKSEFIMNYADDPKDEWVEGVHQMVSEAVRWQMATAGLSSD